LLLFSCRGTFSTFKACDPHTTVACFHADSPPVSSTAFILSERGLKTLELFTAIWENAVTSVQNQSLLGGVSRHETRAGLEPATSLMRGQIAFRAIRYVMTVLYDVSPQSSLLDFTAHDFRYFRSSLSRLSYPVLCQFMLQLSPVVTNDLWLAGFLPPQWHLTELNRLSSQPNSTTEPESNRPLWGQFDSNDLISFMQYIR